MGGGAAAQAALKRIPRIKFPQRHHKPTTTTSGSASQPQQEASNAELAFFSSSKAPTSAGGKASLQPKRTPLSNEEIEAILLGGCI